MRRCFLSQEGEHFLNQSVRRDAVFLAQDRNRPVLDEFIGPADAQDRRIDPLRMQMLHHGTAEAVVENMIFNGTNNFHAAREKLERPGVEWFDPARID